MGVTLDAAHPHAMSVTKGQDLSRRRAGGRGAVTASAGPGLPPAGERRLAGYPGVPASQQAVVATCGGEAPLTRALGQQVAVSWRERESGGDFSWGFRLPPD